MVAASTIAEAAERRWEHLLVEGALRHWLLGANAFFFLYTALPLAAPMLVAAGLVMPGRAIFAVYSLACHQLPQRSYFIFGEQVGLCQRDVAIYGSIFLSGLAFAALRNRLRPLPWPVFLALIAPMAIDGGTQLVGIRESTWELRTFTGALFGIASVWLTYPHLEAALEPWRRRPEASLALVGGLTGVGDES